MVTRNHMLTCSSINPFMLPYPPRPPKGSFQSRRCQLHLKHTQNQCKSMTQCKDSRYEDKPLFGDRRRLSANERSSSPSVGLFHFSHVIFLARHFFRTTSSLIPLCACSRCQGAQRDSERWRHEAQQTFPRPRQIQPPHAPRALVAYRHPHASMCHIHTNN